MVAAPDLRTSVLQAWRTNNAVNVHLVEQIPSGLWAAAIPGVPQRTVRMIAAHLHNSRCSWIRTLGSEHGIAVPARVDRHTVSRRALVSALKRSSRGLEALLQLGLSHDGVIPPSRAYVWRNLPLDVGHVLAYFVGHEGHHRGQIVMAARQAGLRLPREVTNGLWQWTRLARRG
jgi:uncharacterized damage-inducible protein DinB